MSQDNLELLFVGMPNVGKSSLINSLTGSVLKVGNWTGTTVEKRSLTWEAPFREKSIQVVDLPGSFSLHATSPEELVTRNVLLDEHHQGRFLINVIDAGQLERDLYLTLELKQLGLPMIVCLNLTDEAERFGITVDAQSLSERLDLPVVSTVAVADVGAEQLLTALPEFMEQGSLGDANPSLSEEPSLSVLQERLSEVLELCKVVSQKTAGQESKASAWQRRWDGALLHPVLGPVLFLIAMLLVFRFTFLLSDPWITFLGTVQEVAAGWVASLPIPAILASFLGEGVIGGLGTVAAFSPVLFFLYFGMSFMERSGFLPRIAVVADRLLRSFGLSGRALVPLLLGFGCNVPALSACRTLDSGNERLRAAIAIPFMSCSARLAVFALFAAIFFPGREAWVVLGLYVGGLVVGLLSALLLGKSESEDVAHSILELPPFRIPPLKLLAKQAWGRMWRFVSGAGRLVCITVIVVWALIHIPNGMSTDVMNSVYGRVSSAAVPIFRPMGVEDPHLVGALIPGIVAKEVVIGSLATSISGSEPLEPLGFGEGIDRLGSAFGEAVIDTGKGLVALFSGLNLDISPNEESTPELMAELSARTTAAGALAYLVFVLLYTPCVATVAALRDLVGWRWASIMVFYQLAVAYLGGVLVFQISKLLGF